MDYTRTDLEKAILGAILNDYDGKGFMQSNHLSLRKELFCDKKNKFIFNVLSNMRKDGFKSTTPLDVLNYANEKKIRYGNEVNFASYMCELAVANYSHTEARKCLRELVKLYMQEKKRNGTV